MPFVIPYPQIDPVLFQMGSFAVRWYALAYIAGIILGWFYMRRQVRTQKNHYTLEQIDDFVSWAVLGIIIGGRLGYVLFYKPDYYLANPVDIVKIWTGGMSFHGGLLGVILATILFAKKRKVDLLPFGDMIACVAPIGLFFGRIANFINGELFGRISDVPWAMIFPQGGPSPRHPSQLYEALLEGALLFVVLFMCSRLAFFRTKPGALTGVFLCGYSLSRSFVEVFREPDAHLGFIVANITMGQILSLPMILIGLILVFYPRRFEKELL